MLGRAKRERTEAQKANDERLRQNRKVSWGDTPLVPLDPNLRIVPPVWGAPIDIPDESEAVTQMKMALDRVEKSLAEIHVSRASLVAQERYLLEVRESLIMTVDILRMREAA